MPTGAKDFTSYRTCVAHSRTEFAAFASFGCKWSTVIRLTEDAPFSGLTFETSKEM